jgi:rod shape determining protein RodA
MLISFAAIYSAGINCGASLRYLYVQLLASAMGLVCFLLLSSLDYQYYKHLNRFIYILSLALLLSVLAFGSVKRGTKGWFDFGIVSFQPVEIAKIMFILVLASFLDIKIKKIRSVFFIISVSAMLMGHLLLIMLQPDFSSTLSYFPVTLILLFMVGIQPFYLLCIVILCLLAVGIPLLETFLDIQVNIFQSKIFLIDFANFLKTCYGKLYMIFVFSILIIGVWIFLWKLRIKISIIYPTILCGSILIGCVMSIPVEKSLKNYQRKRFIAFLNPNIDPRGAGYNIIQSKIAIGSGRFIGKGFKKGTQTQLGFLPEQHTDFIFSVIGEEGGWIIAQLIIIAYFFFIWRSLVIAKEARDRYGSLVAMGLATMFVFYVVINIGMVMGMMPVTGIPLLLISYGGSSTFSSLCAVGVLSSINMRRYYIIKC